MQTIVRTTGTGTGPQCHQRGRIGHRHQPGSKGEEKKTPPTTRKRNDFLTGRLLPVASDYYVVNQENDTDTNVTTREAFDYLYRSATNYAALLGVALPFPKRRRSSHPRLDIVRLYEVARMCQPGTGTRQAHVLPIPFPQVAGLRIVVAPAGVYRTAQCTGQTYRTGVHPPVRPASQDE